MSTSERAAPGAHFGIQGDTHCGARGSIRVGIGGWSFPPWRDNFYPAGLPHSKELAYASSQLSSIEINSTFYSAQKPATFAKWRDSTPEGFVFSVKASQHATHRKVLAEAGESVRRFVDGGIAELGDKLGPVAWQFLPSKRFEPEDFCAFLALLPATTGGIALRHVLDVRHESFRCPEFLALARRHGAAVVFTDSAQHPRIADVTAGFVYARLMLSESERPDGYADTALDQIAEAARCWAAGGEPPGLPRVQPTGGEGGAGDAAQKSVPASPTKPRDVFVYFINGAKERAPAAARALLKRLA